MATCYSRSKHWEEVLAAGYKIGEHDKAIVLYDEITEKLPDYYAVFYFMIACVKHIHYHTLLPWKTKRYVLK